MSEGFLMIALWNSADKGRMRQVHSESERRRADRPSTTKQHRDCKLAKMKKKTNAASTPGTATSSGQPRILSVPPEIRNRIYGFVFQRDPRQKVDLLEANPPAKDLLITCRQVYQEARLMYREAYRKFWTLTTFKIFMPSREPTTGISRAILLAHIEITLERELPHVTKLELGDEERTVQYWRGIWYHPDNVYVAIIPLPLDLEEIALPPGVQVIQAPVYDHIRLSYLRENLDQLLQAVKDKDTSLQNSQISRACRTFLP